MRTSTRVSSLLAAGLVLIAAPVSGQVPAAMSHAHMQPPVIQDLLADVTAARDKVVGLAEAIPEERFGWRPGEGVRSVGEVVMHVAADNYFLPTAAGTMAPDATGIKPNDYPSTRAFEERQVTKAEGVAHVRASFEHLIAALEATSAEDVAKPITLFGRQTTVQALWITATTHLHEHLGQLIAYARSNDVVPPWSR